MKILNKTMIAVLAAALMGGSPRLARGASPTDDTARAAVERRPYHETPRSPSVGDSSVGRSPRERRPDVANLRGHENIEWSIAYAFHLTDAQKNLPRVLLVGDSICNGYQSEVRRLAEGKFNVSYWVSSYCVTSPGYLKLLAFQLDEATYDVVHFNNGLHSLGTNPKDYAEGLRAALELIRRKQPKARLVWATSTPLKDPALTAKAKTLNRTGAEVVRELGGIETDDLFALLDPLDREANWSDVFHHKPPVRNKTAAAVFDVLRGVLERSGDK